MAIGSYMGRVFTVSSRRIFSPSNIKGRAGSDWATHDLIGTKPRPQWIGPKLKSYTFDILLRAQDGVSPRTTLEYFQRAAESRKTDWFIIGGFPLSRYPFRLVSVSDEWDAVLGGGELISCMVSLSIEEYR